MRPSITRTTSPKGKPEEKTLGFGRFFTDHMAVTEWTEGKGWSPPQVVPYAPIALEPSAGVLHYGQAMFEGLKAFRGHDGVVRIFRGDAHAARLAAGAPR